MPSGGTNAGGAAKQRKAEDKWDPLVITSGPQTVKYKAHLDERSGLWLPGFEMDVRAAESHRDFVKRRGGKVSTLRVQAVNDASAKHQREAERIEKQRVREAAAQRSWSRV